MKIETSFDFFSPVTPFRNLPGKLIVFKSIIQPTTPSELPIAGAPGRDIELSVLEDPPNGRRGGEEENDFFYLEGKSLRLKRPLDRDEKDLSSLMIQVRRYSRKNVLLLLLLLLPLLFCFCGLLMLIFVQ